MGLEQTPWKETAIRVMPEHATVLAEADTPYSLWIELWFLFEAAYREPRDVSLIERIYKYADWCELQPRGETADDDLLTCVSVCFYEHIPTCEAAREDLPNWFSKEDFINMRSVFRYFFNEDEFKKIEEEFVGRTFRTWEWDDPEDAANVRRSD